MNTKTTSPTPPRTAAPASSGAAGKASASWRKYIPHAVGGAIVLFIVNGLRPHPLAVEMEAVKTAPLSVHVQEEGKTRIRHRYIVSPPVSGYLRRVELRAGAPIEAGKTVLAVIEAGRASLLDPRAQAEAEARVKAAEATREQRDAARERAKAALGLAQKDRERNSELRRTGAISAKDWDTAEYQVQMLDREMRAAEFAFRTAEFDLVQAQASLMQAQRPGDAAGEPITIVAPVNGYVLNVYEENARMMVAGTPIMEVGDTQDLEAEIELLSSDAVGVRAGAEVSIEQWGGDRPLRGRVSLVEPGGYTKVSALGVEEQRVKVRVDFVDALPPGITFGDRFRVEARILTWSGERVLQVPTGALFRRGGEWMVFAVAGAKAQLRKVEVGHNNGVAAEVLSGLKEGERVVLHPPDLVADGVWVAERK